MPDKCCVPKCNSNYKTSGEGYVSVFKFPKDVEQRKEWIKSIPRKDWEPQKFSVVCIKHFHDSVISKIEKYKDSSGVWKEFPRSKPVLLPGAVPSIFPCLPAYLSKEEVKGRKCPEKRRQETVTVYEQQVNSWLENDLITNFENFKKDYNKKLNLCNEWLVHSSSDEVVYYKCSFQDIPCMTTSIKVSSELICQVCVNRNILTTDSLHWILPQNLKVSRWSQLENILLRYKEVLM